MCRDVERIKKRSVPMRSSVSWGRQTVQNNRTQEDVNQSHCHGFKVLSRALRGKPWSRFCH